MGGRGGGTTVRWDHMSINYINIMWHADKPGQSWFGIPHNHQSLVSYAFLFRLVYVARPSRHLFLCLPLVLLATNLFFLATCPNKSRQPASNFKNQFTISIFFLEECLNSLIPMWWPGPVLWPGRGDGGGGVREVEHNTFCSLGFILQIVGV